MGIETEEDVKVLSSYFLTHRAASREADAGSQTVRLSYLPYNLLVWSDKSNLCMPMFPQAEFYNFSHFSW